MPRAAPSQCIDPGCPTLVTGGGSRCPEHKKENTRQRSSSRYRSTNDDKRLHDAFYGTHSWRKLRKVKIRKNPLCERCQAAGLVVVADVVDHIVERVDNDMVRLHLGNLMSLCHRCHGAKTREARNARRSKLLGGGGSS